MDCSHAGVRGPFALLEGYYEHLDLLRVQRCPMRNVVLACTRATFSCSRQTPGSHELVALARDLLEAAFAPHDPRSIHEHKTPEEVAEILSKLKPQFIHHPTCKKLLPRILAENGCDLEKTYFDVPRMRSAYPPHFLRFGNRLRLPPASRHLVFGADVPAQLVDADLSA